ncbi:hypothetical protein GobsT_02540 [Gemmata obscuriglobus]|uniref:DUF2171 domain-containing protein n=1 Tax=Gemmata obscuriglobus TaxID=114 RepID=A0A2Z3H5W0_9BACT|nr:DUF2171 domain-containing protein [Gemmata obscuriglobus]AWM41138.1 DUF2171 domain-containing protein [Gemmata obscuriglobus]QEG25527.1 hypothetical protein GobsT_02540 [Gemmata obscuriglobus]VTR98850.1 Uncultured bacterium genome assembly Metasoil_fosmids_resub OS=uncultured bacterium PE=4 SV=1: DUF2171 [Gemmata obscuriglobus UQM 2246]
MSNIKDKVTDAGQTVVDAAKNVGHKIAECASETAAYVKEKAKFGCADKGENQGVAGIKEHMEVYASCGKKVGVVDHLEGNAIKLTRSDSPDGQHHFVPTAWVGRVHEDHVHLTKNSAETEKGWKSDAASCSSCGA